jgi:putative ABC transport system ATP-binding protein
MLKVQKINKTYYSTNEKIEALKNASFNISQGEMLAIVGPSGSGKTTLVNIIAGFLLPDSGSVFINDVNLAELSSRERAGMRSNFIGYIAQDYLLIDSDTAYQNIQIPLQYSGKYKKKEHKNQIGQIAKVLGIEKLLHKKTNKLSGGERQRVAIARAIVNNQELILADEPTGALDIDNRNNVVEILRDLQENHNKTVVIITHDLEVANMCDRIIELHGGEIIRDEEIVRT